MKSISSFEAMAVVSPPEVNELPSLTVVTPCVDIKTLMDRVLRGLQSAPPIGHDDFEMTTDNEYRNAEMRDTEFVDISDDPLVDMSVLQDNINRMKSKPAVVVAPRQDAAREHVPSKPPEVEESPKQSE